MAIVSANSSAKAPNPLPRTTATRGSRPVTLRIYATASGILQKHARDAGRHEIGHGSGGHSFQAHARQIGFAARRQRSDSADLDRDGTEVGKTAQRISSDGERVRIEVWFHRPELLKGDEFIEDQTGAEQVSDGPAVVKFDAQQPGDGRKQSSQNLFERRVEITENAIAHGNER